MTELISNFKSEIMQKKVLITGANTGIGLALVKKFLTEGFFVIGTSRSGEIRSVNSKNFDVLSLDVTSQESVNQTSFILKDKFGSIDLLINNAGVGIDLEETIPQIHIIKETFETNVFGLVNFTESILDCINENGTIFNISSLMGKLNREHQLVRNNATAYRMSKAALNMYTATLASRLHNQQINVNSIHPGWVKTNMGGDDADLTPEFSANGIFNLYVKNIPTATFWNAETEEQMNW